MAQVEYTPTQWADGADGGTPINAEHLNNIEQGIVDIVAAIALKIAANDIADGAVTEAKLAAAAVSASKLAAGAVATAALAADAVTEEKLAEAVRQKLNRTIGTSSIANGAVTSAKLSSEVWGWYAVGSIADIGTLYRCGRIGFAEIYCKKTAAIAAWKSISGTLPGGIKAAFPSRSSLTCEDKPNYICTGRVVDGTLYVENRSGTNWPAIAGGFYITGSVIFPIA